MRLPGLEDPDRLSPGYQRPYRTHLFGLPAVPTSVGLARRTVHALLIAWDAREAVRDNAVLVTSELVTNAITHSASDRIVCQVRSADGVLRIEVEDQNRGSTLPSPRQPRPDDQGGRGLLLVDALSRDWGVMDGAHRFARIVWAELPLDADESGPP